MRWGIYKAQMAKDVYDIVTICPAWAQNGSWQKLRQNMQFFPASGPLELIAIDILVTLLRLLKGNQYAIAIIEKHTKFKRVEPAEKTTATHVANLFIESSRVPYSIRTNFLTDNGVLLTS